MLNKDNWHIISVYVYNSEYMGEILIRILKLIKETGVIEKDIIIHRKWQLGPHIEVILKAENASSYKRINAIAEGMCKYLDGKEIEQTMSYEKYTVMSSRIAQLEEYKGNISPLKKHLEIVGGKYDLDSISTIFSKELYFQIESLLTQFIYHMYEYYYQLLDKEKDIFLIKCMMILTDLHDTNDFQGGEGGIKYGYMTFQSHYEGFKAQLNSDNKTGNRILHELEELDPEICDYYKNTTGDFLRAIQNNMEDYDHADKEYLLFWKEVVKSMLGLYGAAIKNNGIKSNKNHNMNTFFKNNEGKLSNFHKILNTKSKYFEFLNSDVFLKHRMSINAFYTILPLLNISPLHKHKLCKYVADAVEHYYGFDYRRVMEVINSNYME